MKTGERELNAALVLADGTTILGHGFGRPRKVVGEVVFNTGMVGYPEALTDPSYEGQILCLTYPLVGNYGVPGRSLDEFGLPVHFESDRIHITGLIIQEHCFQPSHWACRQTLDEWLDSEGVPGIYGVDTRELTKRLRVHGVMLGGLEVSEEPVDVEALLQDVKKSRNYGEVDFVKDVSVTEPHVYGLNGDPVVLLDCGVKLSILRNLLLNGLRVIRLPHNASADEVMSYEPKGVVLSNGPGNPDLCSSTIRTTRKLAEEGLPILGICLGNQILGLALGGATYKLKYGHRGQNKPCIDLFGGLSYVTSQNHGYGVSAESFKDKGLEVWFLNADDGSVEGLAHVGEPLVAVQFHPEASPGPYDTRFVFNVFSTLVKNRRMGMTAKEAASKRVKKVDRR